MEPNEKLFITRKRKKWKFAHFNAWENCFQARDIPKGEWPAHFPKQQPLTVEIGAGTADLTLGLARLEGDRNFIAIDLKSDRLYTGAKVALHEGLTNAMFVRAQLRDMDDLFASHTLQELWVTFPDPFPRKKQAKHRLTHPAFLKVYRELLLPSGVLHFKTDNRELFLWSLEQLAAEGWQIRELSFDLHDSDLPHSYKITTYYERKFMAQDMPINYVAAVPLD